MPVTFYQAKHIVDRVFDEYLYPTSEQPTRLILTAAVISVDEQLQYDDSLITPEELELLAPGTIIEVDSEQMLVRSVNEASNLLDVIRGMNGTGKKSHTINSIINVSPTWTRQTVFNAVGDAIVELWPRLRYVRMDENVPITATIAEVDSAAEGVQAVYDSKHSYLATDYLFLKHLPSASTGKGIALGGTEGPVDIRYITRPLRPASETDLLDSINVDESWIGVIVLGTMLNLLAQPDIERMMTDFLVDRMKAESVRVGAGQSIREGLVQLYEYRMSKLINMRDREEEPVTSVQQWHAF